MSLAQIEDEFRNSEEAQQLAQIPFADSDADGIIDALDGCPADPNKTEPGIAGCGEPEVVEERDQIREEKLSELKVEFAEKLSELEIEFAEKSSELKVEFAEKLSELEIEFEEKSSELEVKFASAKLEEEDYLEKLSELEDKFEEKSSELEDKFEEKSSELEDKFEEKKSKLEDKFAEKSSELEEIPTRSSFAIGSIGQIPMRGGELDSESTLNVGGPKNAGLDTGPRSLGNPLPEISSDLVCGSTLCDEPLSMEEKIQIYLKNRGLETPSRHQVS